MDCQIENVADDQLLPVNQMSCRVQLTQRQFVMIFVVQHVHQIGIEWMDIIELREILNDLCQPIVEILLCEFDFSYVERPYPGYFVAFMYDCRCFTLCFRQHYVDEVLKN